MRVLVRMCVCYLLPSSTLSLSDSRTVAVETRQGEGGLGGWLVILAWTKRYGMRDFVDIGEG